MKRQEAVLLLISAAVLADEVILVRAFSIGLWHHFAYMVISIALLGFGASGTVLAMLGRRGTPLSAQVGRSGWIAFFAVLFALTVPMHSCSCRRFPSIRF
jgi:hypothetical protein